MTGRGDLQRELETLRRELRQVPRVAEEGDAAAAARARAAPPPPDDMRGEIERVLRELQDKLGEAADEAEDLVAAHPFTSVAAAFLLGVLAAGLISRAR